jgi:hypothetical protein
MPKKASLQKISWEDAKNIDWDEILKFIKNIMGNVSAKDMETMELGGKNPAFFSPYSKNPEDQAISDWAHEASANASNKDFMYPIYTSAAGDGEWKNVWSDQSHPHYGNYLDIEARRLLDWARNNISDEDIALLDNVIRNEKTNKLFRTDMQRNIVPAAIGAAALKRVAGEYMMNNQNKKNKNTHGGIPYNKRLSKKDSMMYKHADGKPNPIKYGNPYKNKFEK